jgi:hypothetical protein
VLTEIDIQTPIPAIVQQRRSGRSFLFLGCRFANQRERTFARQIIKRSSAKHWAVLPEPPTKNELRFLQEKNIQRIDMPLAEFVDALSDGSIREDFTSPLIGCRCGRHIERSASSRDRFDDRHSRRQIEHKPIVVRKRIQNRVSSHLIAELLSCLRRDVLVVGAIVERERLFCWLDVEARLRFMCVAG